MRFAGVVHSVCRSRGEIQLALPDAGWTSPPFVDCARKAAVALAADQEDRPRALRLADCLIVGPL